MSSPETATRVYGEVGPEIEEPLSHEAFHFQKTCMREAAIHAPTVDCPLVETGVLWPVDAIRILDDVYVIPFGPSNPSSASRQGESYSQGGRGVPTGITSEVTGGSNTARTTHGALPDLILPGVGTFIAAYGYWRNLDGDRSIKRTSGEIAEPENEFVPIEDGTLVSYVEPGPRPPYATYYRPEANMPDFEYEFGSALYSLKGGYVVFVDAALLQTFEVTTFADARFAPGGLDFSHRAGRTGLVDYDVYAAVAPASVTGVYAATVGGTLNSLGSPNPGWCPNQCIPGPVAAGGTPLEAGLGAAQGLVYARALEEWRPGSGNTAEGRRADFNQSYGAWVDLLPRWQAVADATWIGGYVWTPYVQMPLGADPWGRPTAPPGFFSSVGWSGFWRDWNGDGFIGATHPGDPYQSGSRPEPNDYLNSKGEFLAVTTSNVMNPESSTPCEGCFNITYTPMTDWGPYGVWFWAQNHPNAFAEAGTACIDYSGAANVNLCLLAEPFSTQPVSISMGPSSQTGGVWLAIVIAAGNVAGPGQYRQTIPLWFPGGSPGFTMCTEFLAMDYQSPEGDEEREFVGDCDVIHPWVGI